MREALGRAYVVEEPLVLSPMLLVAFRQNKDMQVRAESRHIIAYIRYVSAAWSMRNVVQNIQSVLVLHEVQQWGLLAIRLTIWAHEPIEAAEVLGWSALAGTHAH
jgi:hypothetical protein